MDSSRFDDVPFLHQQEKKKTFSRTPRNAAICCVIWLSCSTVDQFFIETQNALVQNAPFQFHFSFRSDFIDKNMAKISTMDVLASHSQLMNTKSLLKNGYGFLLAIWSPRLFISCKMTIRITESLYNLNVKT